MTEEDQDIKDRLFEELRKNFFDVSGACEVVGVSLDRFNSYKDCEYFQSGLADARQWRDDFALRGFKELIEDKNAQAIIEYQKMLRQSDDKNEALNIRKKTMRYLIETADTKALALRKYSDIFGESAKVGEKFYQVAMTEYGLMSPQQRKKDLIKNEDSKLSVMFANGNLDEVGMIQGLLQKQLEDAENAEYPSERAKATEQSIKLTQRLDEIQERKRREEESDETSVFDKLDAVLARTTPDKIDELKEQIMSKGIECS